MLLSLLALALAGPPADDGRAAAKAEARRLVSEIKGHAADGTSAGVNREYRRLLALGVRVDPGIHMLAADVARDQGDSMTALARMYRVPAGSREGPQVEQFHKALQERYAYLRVSLQPGADVGVPSLFSPDEARAAKRMAERVAETGVFIGLVPVGEYSFDGRRFTFQMRYAYSIPMPPLPESDVKGEMASSPPGQGPATAE